MSKSLSEMMQSWHLCPGSDSGAQIDALLAPLCARGVLPDGHESTSAILLGEQYHLGGAQDTRRMARLAGITAADRVVDLACYIGGPARQLARECQCEVVGVDISQVHIALAEKLTELVGLQERVTFMCESADALPLPGESFTVVWSQCPFPGDLSWLKETDRLLKPGGRLAFTGLIRRAACDDPALLSLDEISQKVEVMGFRVVGAEDISDMDLEHGWLPALAKLRANEAHYRELMGSDWVRKAGASIETDIMTWREARMGNGRVVAVKE
jgi:ubiquinone/menaquinone biosynthesis C-methylase UbiE